MSENNQKLWERAIAAFPYPLQSPTETRGKISAGIKDFSYSAEYKTPITKVFEDDIIARVRVLAFKEAGNVTIWADIDLFLNDIHSGDTFLQYGSGQGHNGVYQKKQNTWMIMVTD